MRPKVTKTKDYTQKWAEYTINHRPISVQRMLANPSIRTVLSRTGCSIDVQSSRTSNHLVTAGVIDELAIIRVHIPDEITLDVLNSELENAFPAYRYRQQYRHQLPELVGQTKRLMSEYAKELTRMDQYTGEEISIPRSRQNGDDFGGHRDLQKRVHATSSKSVSEVKPPAPIKYFSPGLNLHNVSQPSNVINDPIVTVVTDISTKCVDIYHEIIYESWPQSISFDENGTWPSFVSRTHLDYRCPSVESCNSLAISRQEEQSISQVETPDKTDCLRNEHFYRSTVFNEYHCQQHHSNEPCTHAIYPELTVEVSTTFNHGSNSRDQKLLEKYVNGKVVDVVPWYFDTALLQTSLTESASKSVPSTKDQFPPVRHRDQTVSHSHPVHTNTRSSFEETEVLSSMFGRTVVFWEPTLVLPSTQQSLVVSVARKTTIEINPLWSDREEPYPRSLFLNEHSEIITHQCLISVNDCDFLKNKLTVNAQGPTYHSLDDPESDGLVTVTDVITVNQYYGQPTSSLNEYTNRFGSFSIVDLPMLKGNEITIESNIHGQVTEIKDSSTSDVRVISVIKLSSACENEGLEDELNEILDGEDVCAQWEPRMHPDMTVQDMTGTKNPQLTEAGAIQDCKRKSKSQVQAASHRTSYRRAPVTLGGNEEKNEITSQSKHYAIERIDRKPSGSEVTIRQSTGTVIRGKRIFIKQSTAVEHRGRQLLRPIAGQKIPTVGTTKKLTLASSEGAVRITEVSKTATSHKAKKATKPDAVQQNVLAKTGKTSTIQIAFINDEDFSDAGNPPNTSDKNTRQTNKSEDQTNSIQAPSLANDKRPTSDPVTNHEFPIPKQTAHHSEYLEYLENVIQHQALHTVKYVHRTDSDTGETPSDNKQEKIHKPKPKENQTIQKHQQADDKYLATGSIFLGLKQPASNQEGQKSSQINVPDDDILMAPIQEGQKSSQINVPDEFSSSQAATIASVLARENTKEKLLTGPFFTEQGISNLPSDFVTGEDMTPALVPLRMQFKSSPDQCSLAVPVGPVLEAATMEDQSGTSIANLDAGVQCSKSVFPVEESTISLTDSFSLMDKYESQKRFSEILLNLESFKDVLQVSPLQTPSHTPRVSLRLIRDVGTGPVALGTDTQIVIPTSLRSRVAETELPSNSSPNMPSPLGVKTASDTTSATHLSLISPSSTRDIPERHHTTVSDQRFVSSVVQGGNLDSEFRVSELTSPHLQQPQSGVVTVVPEALKPRTHETSTVHGQWSTDGRLTRGRASTHEQQLQQTSHRYSPSSLGHKDHEMKRTELGTERGGRLSLVEPISKTSEFCLPMTDIHAQEHRFSLRSGGETLPLSDREMSDQEVVFCSTCQLSESKQSENGMYCGYRCPILLAIPSCTLTFTDSSHSEKTNDLKFATDASPQATTFVGHAVVAQSLGSETAPLDEENSFMNSLMNVKLHDYYQINESISRSSANVATQEGRKKPIEILPKVSNSEIGNATQSDAYNVPMLPKTKSIAPSQSKIHATEFFDNRAHSNPDAEPSSTLVTVRSLLKSVPKNNTAHAELSPEGKLTTVATVHAERQPSLCDSISEPLKSVREDPQRALYTVSSTTLPVQQPQVSNVMSNKIPNIPASLTSPSPDALRPKASNSVTFDITDSKTEKPQSEICTGKLDLSGTAIGSAQIHDRNIPPNQPGLSSNPASSIESYLPALIHDIPLYTSSRDILPNCTRTTCPFLVGSSDHYDTVSHVQRVVKCGFPNIEKSKLYNNELPSPTIGIPCFVIMDALLELTDAMADPEYQVARVEQSAAPGLIRSNNSEIGSHLADQRGYVILKGTYIPPKSVWNQCWEKTVTTGMARTFLCNLRPLAALSKAPPIFSGRGMVFDRPPLRSCPVEENHGTKRNPSNLQIKDKECTKFPEQPTLVENKTLARYDASLPGRLDLNLVPSVAGPAGASGVSPAEMERRSTLGLFVSSIHRSASYSGSRSIPTNICTSKPLHQDIDFMSNAYKSRPKWMIAQSGEGALEDTNLSRRILKIPTECNQKFRRKKKEKNSDSS
ncbi:hypothetical protein D915_006974 [Fasciola hepatica]|uniref:Uncharacterized protein n=1 Tax=Fasciola hepatica TaxID=6192 RepID=A0A4E0R5I3_FASHE|nr:hypothetical protein D915_006974 [Fasciola hepatica]